MFEFLSYAHQLIDEKMKGYLVASLWHYTPPKGFTGIVKAKRKISFRFTNVQCLANQQETEQVLNVFRTIKAENTDLARGDFYEWLNMTSSSGGTVVSCKPEKSKETDTSYKDCDAFVCCFCKEGDEPELWEKFAEGDGCSLNFYPMLFERYEDHNLDLLPSSFEGTMRQYHVIYEETEQKAIMKAIIDKLWECSQTIPSLEDRCSFVTDSWSGVLQLLELIFKPAKYEKEKEYRFVVYQPKKTWLKFASRKWSEGEKWGILLDVIDPETYFPRVMAQRATQKEFTEKHLKKCGFDKCKVVIAE